MASAQPSPTSSVQGVRALPRSAPGHGSPVWRGGPPHRGHKVLRHFVSGHCPPSPVLAGP